MTGYEFAHAVDATQLKNAIAYGGFKKDSKVTAGSDVEYYLADGNSEYFL